ncbi:MAG: hypothetical protein HYR76_08965 [Ignavibacteria bacterium]|nr:hypothetical protein [Ignavibacteria bacterium]MBI3765466.1 hypothetical protein [Ignavibacteriales bacterium]
MTRAISKDLTKFLKPFDNEVKAIGLFLRKFVLDIYPDSYELIYDNYNALVIGFSTSDRAGDAFCSIAVYSKYANFGFNRGSEIEDPEKKLVGSGSLYRYMTVRKKEDFPKAYIKKLSKYAYENSMRRLKDKKHIAKGITITKSISPVKRRPK